MSTENCRKHTHTYTHNQGIKCILIILKDLVIRYLKPFQSTALCTIGTETQTSDTKEETSSLLNIILGPRFGRNSHELQARPQDEPVACYGLNVRVSPRPNLYGEALTPNVMVFGSGACGSD